MNTLLNSSFFKFGAVGFTSTVIDIILLNLSRKAKLPVWAATGIGFLGGSLNGYILNSLFVFHQNYSAVRYQRYFLISFGGLLLTEAIMHTLHVRFKLMSLNKAKLVAVVIVFFWNYGLSKIWVFN